MVKFTWYVSPATMYSAILPRAPSYILLFIDEDQERAGHCCEGEASCLDLRRKKANQTSGRPLGGSVERAASNPGAAS